jgi:DNA polymerase III subunit delta
MRLQFNQLKGHLHRSLSPVYLICGDEPLQLRDGAQAVRDEARRRGFAERELLEQDGNFDWSRLSAASQALSLFSARRLLELRVSTPRLGRDGGQAVTAYCENPPADDLLLVVAPNLEHKELKARWVQTLERAGVLVQVRQLEGERLEAWIAQQLRAGGLEPEQGVCAILAERVEGNMLAAAQEVEKLKLLYGEGSLDRTRLAAAIADSARYDVFDLSDALLGGERARVQRIVRGLAAEGTAPALVLWAILRELRMLASAAYARPSGSVAAVLQAYRVWDSRKPLVQKALKRLPLGHLHELIGRCGEADREIKGLAKGDPWQTLAAVADALAAGPQAGPARASL